MKTIPSFARLFYPEAIFKMPPNERSLYLTIDDGPQSDSTLEILRILNAFEVKATFFCTGKNIEENPHLYDAIIEAKQGIGNHTFSHLNGWKANMENYVRDVAKAKSLIDSNLFRPPYGRIRFKQFRNLRKNYQIIFWTLLLYDFKDKSVGNILQALKRGSKDGAVIVFHDHQKNLEKIREFLPAYLEWALKCGFNFRLFSSD